MFFYKMINFRWHPYKLRLTDTATLLWEEFKAFLQKSFGDAHLFVDTIWRKMKIHSQYQLEELQDWASNLKHLQSIFFKYDAAGASAEMALLLFLQEGLKTLVKAKIEQRGQELNSCNELIEKIIEKEAKASL